MQKVTLGVVGRVNGAVMKRIREITVEYLKAKKMASRLLKLF